MRTASSFLLKTTTTIIIIFHFGSPAVFSALFSPTLCVLRKSFSFSQRVFVCNPKHTHTQLFGHPWTSDSFFPSGLCMICRHKRDDCRRFQHSKQHRLWLSGWSIHSHRLSTEAQKQKALKQTYSSAKGREREDEEGKVFTWINRWKDWFDKSLSVSSISALAAALLFAARLIDVSLSCVPK